MMEKSPSLITSFLCICILYVVFSIHVHFNEELLCVCTTNNHRSKVLIHVFVLFAPKQEISKTSK